MANRSLVKTANTILIGAYLAFYSYGIFIVIPFSLCFVPRPKVENVDGWAVAKVLTVGLLRKFILQGYCERQLRTDSNLGAHKEDFVSFIVLL